MLSKIDSIYCKHTLERFHQGDILRSINVLLRTGETADGVAGKKLSTTEMQLEYAVVITQECDLEQDFNSRNDTEVKSNDKYLQSILITPAYPANKVKEGIHLRSLSMNMEKYNSERWGPIKKNNVYRYHYLREGLDYQVPELIIDFKHCFTISRDVLYINYKNTSNYVATISELFREEISIRFSQYVSRIGLPDI